MIAPAPRLINLNHARHQPLKTREELALLAIIRAGGPAAHIARQKLVNANLKFVVAVARNFIACGIPMEDLINEGALGMVRAAEAFEVSTGNRFVSYAVWWVRQAIVKYLHDHGSTIKVPSPSSLKAKVDRAPVVARRRPGLAAQNSQTNKEQAQAQVDAIQRLRNLQSIEDLMEVGWEPVDKDQDPTARLDGMDTERRIDRFLSTLKPREQDVVKAYYGLGTGVPLTLEEVGERFNLTRERVRQIKENAMGRMRHAARVA